MYGRYPDRSHSEVLDVRQLVYDPLPVATLIEEEVAGTVFSITKVVIRWISIRKPISHDLIYHIALVENVVRSALEEAYSSTFVWFSYPKEICDRRCNVNDFCSEDFSFLYARPGNDDGNSNVSKFYAPMIGPCNPMIADNYEDCIFIESQIFQILHKYSNRRIRSLYSLPILLAFMTITVPG